MAGVLPESLMSDYLERITSLLQRIAIDEAASITEAARLMADHTSRDRLIHVYGPGGHSNLAAQEVFFRAGSLANVSAILDEGTLLSNGALRSTEVERTPGYGERVVEDNEIGQGDLLILINAYGINAAVIDAALTARKRGATVIGVSSRTHAESTTMDHPARHPSCHNLHDLVDVHVDSKIPVGDAVLEVHATVPRTGSMSTFANAFILNALIAETIGLLVASGRSPHIWCSGNAPGGDERNALSVDRFKERVKWL